MLIVANRFCSVVGQDSKKRQLSMGTWPPVENPRKENTIHNIINETEHAEANPNKQVANKVPKNIRLRPN